MSDASTNTRRKHTQRIKLGILIVITPWLLLGLIGLVSAGVSAAQAARLPIDEIRPMAIATLGVSALASLVGVAIATAGIIGLTFSKPSKGAL